MFHIADAFVCMMASALCCSNYFQPAFDPLATLKGVQDNKIQRMLLVPTMINMVVHQHTIGDYDLDALETKIQKIKTLTALNVFISELNGVLVDMHKNNPSDYNRFYAFWKKQEKDINDGTA